MNLQTNPECYAELISSTHSIEDKIATIRYLQKYGVSICCGGIFGLGENWRDRVKSDHPRTQHRGGPRISQKSG